MGVFQLPDSVDGDAAGCLAYSFFCLLVNIILIWLIWTHHERTSYVAYIAYFTQLATVSSIVQQLYDYALWKDIMTEQFYYGKLHADDAETQYQKGIMGLKLALAYVRIFCFMVESSLVFFFSMSLAATVYGWWAKTPNTIRKISIIGRILPIALGVVSTILLQLEFTHQSFLIYFIIANAQLVLSLAGSCIFLLMILFKYVQTRWQLQAWQTVQYGQGASTTGTSGMKSTPSRRSRAFSNKGKPSATFDNWLVIRLTIAFMTLCVFEWTNIAPRISAKGRIVESVNETVPDLSEKRAMSTVTGYLSGVSPSLLAFVVFGTTKTFQHKIYKTFIPSLIRNWWKKNGLGRGHEADDDFACRNAGGRLPFSSTANSSYARASTLVGVENDPSAKMGGAYGGAYGGSTSTMNLPPPPTTPRTPRRSLSNQTSIVSIRKPEHAQFLMPIYEPEENESQMTRRSQIGLAISASPFLGGGGGGGFSPTEPTIPTPTTPGRRTTYGTGTFFRDESVETLNQIPLSRFNTHGTISNTTTSNLFHGRSNSIASTTTTIWSDARRGSSEARGQSRTRYGSVS